MDPDQESSQTRKRIAVVQGLCGIVAIACGIALIPLKAPDGSDYYVLYFSRIIGNAGFGIWGGAIIFGTAVMGCRKGKTMTALYASFSLVSIAVAVILISISSIGLARFSRFTYSNCDSSYRYHYSYYYDDCCLYRYSSDCYHYYDYFNYYFTEQPTHLYDPYKDYDSEECQGKRNQQWREEEYLRLCEERVKKNRSANLAVLSILCFVSVVALISNFIAAIVGFKFVCRGCCKTPDQRVVYLAYPPNAQPGSIPMVVLPNTLPGSVPLQVAGIPSNAAQYPPGAAAMSPGSFPYPVQMIHPAGGPNPQVMTGAVQIPNTAIPGTMQGHPVPPPAYKIPQDNK